MKETIKVPGEVLLILVLMINSMGVQFMTKSGFGISAISSVPYVFNKIFPVLSFGTWNYIFQSMLVASLMILRKHISPSYLISFAAGIIFGKMLDVHAIWMAYLPNMFVMRVIYLFIGMVIIAFGICLANNCMLPIIPTDMFPRDFSSITSRKYQSVKTIFDLSCLATTAFLSIIFMKSFMGIGLGTVVCSMFTGKIVAMFQSRFEKHFTVYRAVEVRFNRGRKAVY